MTDIIVKVMVDILLILALATKEIKQGKISKFIPIICHPLSTYRSLERFVKKLVGRSEIEDALRRLDKLTHEEGRMAAAQGLRATHGVGERVSSLGNVVHDLGDGVNIAINKMDAVLNGAHPFFFWLSTPLSDLWPGGENMREELQKVAKDVGDLVKDAGDDKRS
jgi:hypothetical protein